MTIPTSISGFPRIGRDRELKKAIEAYWKAMPRSTMCVRPPRASCSALEVGKGRRH